MPVDLFTFGETMARLSTPTHVPLEQTHALDLRFGGSESNVASNAARMGLHTMWFSHLPRNPLGFQCVSFLRAQGVDTSTVRFIDNARMGLYFVEFGAAPRGVRVWYDRAQSAASQIQPEDLPVEPIQAARWVHLSGISPALSDGMARATERAMRLAREAAIPVSFDVNYRSLLWSPETCAKTLAPLCIQATHVFVAERDAQRLFGVTAGEAGLRALQERFGGVVIMSRGVEGPLAFDGETVLAVPTFEAAMVDRLGAGDSFAAGVLCRLIEGAPLEEALRFGAALAALALSIPGDVATVQRDDVERVLNQTSGDLKR